MPSMRSASLNSTNTRNRLLLTMENIGLEIRAGNIGVATLDMPGRPFNVFSEQMMDELELVIEQACGELQGLVICSGKNSFVAGADLRMIKDFANMRFEADREAMRNRFSRLGRLFRRIEQAPIPVVAAINGLALGGGLELAMACHGRVCVDSESRLLGLPEILLGLLPGAGGTQRLPRIVGIPQALKMLLGGAPVTPQFALEYGLVDHLVREGDLLERALTLAATIRPEARWDQPDWRLPEVDRALLSSPGWRQYCLTVGGWSGRQHDLYPAVASIIDCVGRGAELSLDEGCDVEWDIFVELMSDPVAANMVVTGFLNKGLAESAQQSQDAAASAVAGYLAGSKMSQQQLARAALAVDAGALFKRAGLTIPSCDASTTRDERVQGLVVLAAVALKMLQTVSVPHDALDAVAVLRMGWPAWTGGPIAYLAMLQREELVGYNFPPDLAAAVAAINRPLKTKASYSQASQVA
jgi:enoyl-CoA hydratase/carnithine racemase